MKTIYTISLVAILIVLGTVAAAEQTVKLGLISPQSGSYSVYGQDQQRAAVMAVEEINADGGILGHQVELIIMDSKSRADVSAESVFELIKNQRVEAVFGGVSGEATGIVSDICQRSEVVFMAPVAFANTDGGKKSHRYSFQGGFNPRMAARATADYMNQNLSGQKLCYLVTDQRWGWSTESNLRNWTQTRDEVDHKRFLIPPGTNGPALENILDQVRACQPKALILVQLGDDLVASLKMISANGLKDKLEVVAPVVTLDLAEAVGADAMAGVVGCTDWTWCVPYKYNHPEGIGFVDRFSERFGRYPSSLAANAYTCLKEYQIAVQQVGSFDAPAVIENLEGRQFSSLKDQQQWRSWDHQCVQSVYVVQGKPKNEVLADGYQLDFFNILDKVSGQSVVATREEWNLQRERAGLSTSLEPLEAYAGE
ncbi:MAG: ABC transporter substrate-binding protein [candidate division Zixibacteria bacterium]|nr:ABC transporter substrate-binding protein [candidate division Zixibacteria bacterium]